MTKPAGIPNMLVSLAVNALPGGVASLANAGENVSEHVWAFFDARVPPGRSVAAMLFRKQGATEEQSLRRVDTAIKEARAKGSLFSVGMMMKVPDFERLLRDLRADVAGIASLRAWCDAEVPPGAMRVLIVAGPKTQVQYVPVEGGR